MHTAAEQSHQTTRQAVPTTALVMGPPSPGPTVTVKAPGMFLALKVNDSLDAEILNLFVAGAERRRYARYKARR